MELQIVSVATHDGCRGIFIVPNSNSGSPLLRAWRRRWARSLTPDPLVWSKLGRRGCASRVRPREPVTLAAEKLVALVGRFDRRIDGGCHRLVVARVVHCSLDGLPMVVAMPFGTYRAEGTILVSGE